MLLIVEKIKSVSVQTQLNSIYYIKLHVSTYLRSSSGSQLVFETHLSPKNTTIIITIVKILKNKGIDFLCSSEGLKSTGVTYRYFRELYITIPVMSNVHRPWRPQQVP